MLSHMLLVMDNVSKDSDVQKEKIPSVFQCLPNKKITIFKVLLYIILLTFFVQYYFRDYVGEYLKGRSSYITETKNEHQISLPNIIVCMDPPFKPSMTQKYGYSFTSQLWKDGNETYKNFNYSAWQMYQELSYRLRQDVNFKIGNNKKLREGINLMENQQEVVVTTLATYRHGICTMIQPNFQLYPIDNLKLKIYLKTKVTDTPENINLFLTSNNA